MTRKKNPTDPARPRTPPAAAGGRAAGSKRPRRMAAGAASTPAARAKPARQRLTQAERTALSDTRMLDAAVQLLHERGTHNTTLKEVGERAGYSRGLASSRFGSKEALFFELLNRFNRRWKDESASAVGLRHGLDAFRAANNGLIAFFRAEERFIRVMYMIAYEMVGSSALMREQLAGQHEAYRHGIARWIREGVAEGEVRRDVAADRIALQYVAGVLGIIYQWLVSAEAVDCAQALEDLREHTLRVIEA